MNCKLGLILFLITALLSCDPKDPMPDALAPTDLVLNVDVVSDGSGKVTAVATANGCDYYEFNFGENGSSSFMRDDDGNIDYVYDESGTYTIVVRAHSTEKVYSVTSSVITVELSLSALIPQKGYSTPASYEGYNMIWMDEFEGTELNPAFWKYETGTGNGGWGNNELQYYRDANATVQDGHLFIEAKKENFNGSNYTSSRLVTLGKQSFKYGRVDIRAALPKGQGIWPALWMLGANIETVGWPACGEIDIMELIGGQGKDNTIYGTAHWDNGGNHANYGDHHTLSSGIYTDEFHVFSIIWNETSIKWLMDDNPYNDIDITPTGLSEFHQEFFFIFNVAVGGDWPGKPDSYTLFPQTMIVDYIRVFQLK